MTYLAGIDVSLYQDDIRHALIGQSFCVVKVSQAGYPDPKVDAHFAACEAAGVVPGGYHWLDPQPDAISQAIVFLRHAGPARFLAVDVEGRVGPTTARGRQMAREFIAYVKAHDSRKVLLYSSRGTWPGDCGQDANWVADYSGDPNRAGVSPRIPWLFWQRSGTGIDRDYFAGTPADLAAFAGQHPAPKPQPEPSGEPMFNLVPVTAHRVIDIPAGTVLEQTPGGDRYSTTPPGKVTTLGFLGSTATHHVVADGDAGVYVNRSTKGLVVRTADQNAGI